MKATITVRIDRPQQKALRAAARRRGVSASVIVRDALDRALATDSLAERAGHLRGALQLPRGAKTSWRTRLRDRNWRP